MSHWNYRLVRTEHEEIVLAEVYYDNDGNPNAYTASGCRIGGESIADIREALGLAANALTRPTLDDKDFTRQRRHDALAETGEYGDEPTYEQGKTIRNAVADQRRTDAPSEE